MLILFTILFCVTTRTGLNCMKRSVLAPVSLKDNRAAVLNQFSRAQTDREA